MCLITASAHCKYINCLFALGSKSSRQKVRDVYPSLSRVAYHSIATIRKQYSYILKTHIIMSKQNKFNK